MEAHYAALEELTREQVPLDWATAQVNLGHALSTLGERESGTGRLEGAVAAYRAALEVFTPEDASHQYGVTTVALDRTLTAIDTRKSEFPTA